ncbi:hypothetical protein M3I54_24970 [Paraburkholderia sp. CNPSo 3274]|uniref:YXWGXW repeat-containing protein n=1 Tax=Paraburkholderia sp. CNPSo 3274 TaxID=2940932 RepID=UPI0020B78132|nr:YXWGXW repeat-containing protein [Paraburkholderia sp. CNPSo 3274]MCP3710179.1 hypothetical protein [Paraburkholderia sp. CNPSo 3274]
MKIKLLHPVTLVACAALLSACIVEPGHPPEPAPRVETPPPAPAQGYAWAKGHYRWEGNQWVWIPGHWVRAY